MRRDGGIHLEDRCGSADCVFNAVLQIDHAIDLFNCGSDTRRPILKCGCIGREKFDLHWFRRVREVANHVLQNLRELDVDTRLFPGDPCAQIGDNFIR